MRIDWESVDWTKQDIQIAREVGRTSERVRQMRRALQMPDPPTKWWTQRSHEIAALLAPLRHKVATSRELCGVQPDIARGHGVIVVPIPIQERELGRKYPYEIMNWNLPNADLEEIWKAKRFTRSGYQHSAIAQRRYEDKKGPSRWHRQGGRRPTDWLYWRAIEKEKSKAKTWFNGQQGLGH